MVRPICGSVSGLIARRLTATAVAGTLCILGFATAAAAQDPAQPTVPIEGTNSGSPQPPYIGAPAKPRPIHHRRFRVPRHPFMAPNGRSNLHNDAYQTDTYQGSGPLGIAPELTSTLFFRECASVAFDSRGRIVTICVGLDRPVLALLDPVTLETLAAMALPPRQAGGENPFTDFSGGGYFYLDDRDRAVIPTTTRHIEIIAVGDRPGFQRVADLDLTAAIGSTQKVISALPDFGGRIWFAGTEGTIGWIERDGTIHSRELGERISNSFAVGKGGGVFVVSDRALYRLEAHRGRPQVIWRRRYPNDGIQKSGQTSPGSGTTPTLIGRRYVAITDNRDPIRVIVYDRSRRVGRRLVCRQKIFGKGSGSTDQSLIAVKNSIIAENNFGYTGPAAVQGGRTTTPGLERVVLRRRPAQDRRHPGRNCSRKWHSAEVAPSVVAKLSLANGLIYTYTKPTGTGTSDPWYLTALDFRTGRTVFKRLTGFGLGFNNNYAPVTIGPDGAAYVGTLGGLVRVADR